MLAEPNNPSGPSIHPGHQIGVRLSNISSSTDHTQPGIRETDILGDSVRSYSQPLCHTFLLQDA